MVVNSFDIQAIGFTNGNLIVQLEGDAERVEARAKVGSRGWHANGNGWFSHGARYCIAGRAKSSGSGTTRAKRAVYGQERFRRLRSGAYGDELAVAARRGFARFLVFDLLHLRFAALMILPRRFSSRIPPF